MCIYFTKLNLTKSDHFIINYSPLFKHKNILNMLETNNQSEESKFLLFNSEKKNFEVQRTLNDYKIGGKCKKLISKNNSSILK
jgi:hypothetical protein